MCVDLENLQEETQMVHENKFSSRSSERANEGGWKWAFDGNGSLNSCFSSDFGELENEMEQIKKWNGICITAASCVYFFFFLSRNSQLILPAFSCVCCRFDYFVLCGRLWRAAYKHLFNAVRTLSMDVELAQVRFTDERKTMYYNNAYNWIEYSNIDIQTTFNMLRIEV